MPTHENNDALLVGGYLVRPLRDLPRAYQLAITHYLAVDGEAWDWPEAMGVEMSAWAKDNPGAKFQQIRTKTSEVLENHLDHFLSAHGDMLIGMALVDMDLAKQHVMAVNEDLRHFETWDAYHAWYKSKGNVPSHPNHDRWPCILSCMGYEAFEDGWHRLHSYAAAGHATLPVAFFPDDRHLRYTAAMEVAEPADDSISSLGLR